MNVDPIFWQIGLTLVVLAWLVLPLVNGRSEEYSLEPFGADEESSTLAARRAAALAAIKDLDYEHETGKIDDDEYKALRSRYVVEAAGVLTEIEQVRVEQVAAIEKSVAERKKSYRTKT